MATDSASPEAISGVVSRSEWRNDSRVIRTHEMPKMYTAPSHPTARVTHGCGLAISKAVPAAWTASVCHGAASPLPMPHMLRATFSGLPRPIGVS